MTERARLGRRVAAYFAALLAALAVAAERTAFDAHAAAAPPTQCELYPIGLHIGSLTGVAPGDIVPDIVNGGVQGGSGWLSWTGENLAGALFESLTPPGNAHTYVNPLDPSDHVVSAGDVVAGKAASPDGRAMRDALDQLVGREIVVPVWDQTTGKGSAARYRVARFAVVSILDYSLKEPVVRARYLRDSCVASGNRPPTATGQNVSTAEDTPLPITLSGSDPDGDPLTFALASPPSHGSYASGVYTPAPNFNGPDSFTFRASDGSLVSAPATISIGVTPVNDPPLAANDAATVSEDVPAALDVRANDSDVDGDALLVSAVTAPAHGTAEIVVLGMDAGKVLYRPALNYHGPDSFSYTIADGHGGTATANVTLTVAAVNDAPVAQNVSARTGEDVAVPIALVAADVDGDALAFEVLDPPDHGSYVAGVYTPATNFNGSDSFTYRAGDGALFSNVATVQIIVDPANDPPLAVDDSAAVSEDVPRAIDVLANDSDVDGDALLMSAVTAPAHGTATIIVFGIDAGKVLYSPALDFSGTDQFSYTVSDGHGGTDTADVAITVAGQNEAPVASDVSVGTDEDIPVVVPFAAIDPEGDVISFEVVAGPAHGSVLAGVYRPDGNFHGADSLTYRARDAAGLASNVATVSITVASVNDVPTATDVAATTAEDTPVSVTLAGADVDGDTLTFEVVQPPTHGSFLGGTYTPAANFHGTDTFTFRADDGVLLSALATATITVTPVNDAPTASDVSAATDEDAPVAVALAGADVDGDTLTFAVVDAPDHGSYAGGTYTPDPNFNGTDTFTFRANDGALDSSPATATITVRPVNDPPVANGFATATDEDTPLPVAFSANDVDGDTLTFSVESGPAHGAFASGVYSPAANYHGPDEIRFRANDGVASSNVAVVAITVNPVNDAPVATDDAYGADTDVVLTVPGPGVLGNDADVDGDSLTATLVTDAAHGAVSLGANGGFTYTPAAGYSGPDAFTYRAGDGSPLSDTATVTLTVAPPALQSIAVTPANATIAPDATEQYAANGTYSNGTTRNLTATATWSSTNETVATISAAGLATGEEPGTTTIRATQDGVTGTATLTVSERALVEIVVQPEAPIVLVGSPVDFSATGVRADGTAFPLTGESWSSSNEGVAIIGADGVASTLADGTTTIRASKDGVTGQTVLTVQQSVLPTGDPPLAVLTAPADGASIGAPVAVTGTASSATLSLWRLELAPAQSPVFTELARGTTNVTAAGLGTFDPTVLMNDQYTLRLTVSDRSGRSTVATRTVTVVRDQKVGNFTVAFLDLTVPVSGIPIQVSRTYDSRDKRVGDFGVGWTLGVKALRARASGVHGESWQQTRSGGLFPQYCVVPTKPHVLTITTPSGTTERFQPVISPQCQQIIPITFANLTYQPLPGTRGTLTPLDGTTILYAGGVPGTGQVLDDSTLDPVDPQRFQYTAPSGDKFVIDKVAGLQSITDTKNNTLTFGAGGITHSSGAGITFTRDGQGRITKIRDPLGNEHAYAYDVNGDLASHTDAVGGTTSYTYDIAHGLLDIRDPRGNRGVRNDYDDDGRLISTTDAAGNEITFDHDLTGQRDVVTDRLGNTTIIEYDANGNVTREVDPLGKATTRAYDALGNKTSETNPLGLVTQYTYDASGNRLTERNHLGQTITFTYNATGDPLTSSDPLGNVTTIGYDSAGNVLNARDPAGGQTTSTYSAQGNPLTTTDPTGKTTTFTYDGRGNLTRSVDALGNAEDRTYDANGNVLSITRTRTVAGSPQTLTESFAYDGENRVIRHTDAAGGVTLTTYTPTGNVATTTDPVGRVTTFEYDALDRQTAVVHPDGFRELTGYDAEGHRTSTTDRIGTTAYTYDAAGRLTRTTYPDGTFRSVGYDDAGRKSSETNERGHTITFEYDGASRPTAIVDALGGRTLLAYDAAGRLLTRTDQTGRVTGYVYDGAGRLIRVNQPGGTFTTSTFDLAGRKTSDLDQLGRPTSYGYDAVGRLTSVTDPLSGVTSYEYDAVGNRTRQTDAAGRSIDYGYDRVGRLTSRTLPLGMSETRSYDAAGRLITHTDFNGNAIGHSYDLAGRLASKTLPGGATVDYDYGANGRLANVADATGELTFEYDARGRPTEVDGPNGVVSYTYDATGNRTSVTTPGGTVDYSYDAADRLSRVADPSDRATTFGYDAAGRMTGIAYPNGISGSLNYDAAGRLTSIAYGAGLRTFTYSYDATGRITNAVDQAGRNVSYAYDAAGRLTQEKVGAAATDYVYDAAGNRTSKTDASGTTAFAYDANGRLSSAGGVTYGYDANGSLTTKTGPSGTTTYAYDPLGRLAQATAPGGNTSYAYDPLGNRIRKTGPAGATTYLVDPFAPSAATAPFEPALTETSDRRAVDPLAQVLREVAPAGAATDYVYAGDRLLSLERGGTPLYYLPDAQHSTRALVDGAGAVTDSYDYDAFGNVAGSTGSTVNPYTYTGQRYDESIEAYYLRARNYDPAVGRFTSIDPVAGSPTNPLSQNPYLYALGDPVNFYDPTGKFFAGFSGFMAASFARFAFYASPFLYMFNHIMNRLSVVLGAHTLRAFAYSLSSGIYRLAGYSPRLLNLHAGQVFERIVNPMMRLLGARAQVVIQGGAARVDWIWNGILVDTKLGGYFSRGQFLHYIAEARVLAGQINYITLRAPPSAVVEEFKALAAAEGVVVKFFTLFPF